MTDERPIEEALTLLRERPGLAENVQRIILDLVDAVQAGEKAHAPHTPTDDERASIIDEHTDAAWQTIADALGNLGYDLNSHEDTAAWVQQYLFRRSEPQSEPSDAQVEAFITAIFAEGYRLDRRAVVAGLRAVGGAR